MSKTSRLSRTALTALAVTACAVIATSPLAAKAGSSSLQGAEVVKVSVNFSSQTPLADLGDDGLASAQKAGRKFIYRMARDECEVLKAILAKTCRLTNLSVNAQVRNHNDPSRIHLYMNGSANLSITLKGDDD